LANLHAVSTDATSNFVVGVVVPLKTLNWLRVSESASGLTES